MNEDLYQQAILDHAHASVGEGRLDAPDSSATADNPLCGDRVTIDLRLDDGQVAEIAQHTRGCVLCKAAASIVAKHAAGHSAAALREIGAALAAMLKSDGPAPEGDWAELEAFAPVADHRSRHHCVLLPFEAMDEAFGQTEQAN